MHICGYLRVKVQHRHSARLHDCLNCREAGAVVLTFDLPILQEPVLLHVPLKLLLRHKVVIVAGHLPRTHQPRRICSVSKQGMFW